MKIRTFRYLALVVLTAMPFAARAQIRTNVVYQDDQSQRVADALSARIGGTTRYRLVNAPSGPLTDFDLQVLVMCFDMERLSNTAKGYACAIEMFYFPMAGLEEMQLLGIVAGPNASDVGEDAFQYFIKDTTDEKLQQQRNSMLLRVKTFCTSHRDICQGGKS